MNPEQISHFWTWYQKHNNFLLALSHIMYAAELCQNAVTDDIELSDWEVNEKGELRKRK